MDLAVLEERLGYRFSAPELLQQAVTHRSHGAVHNERLEFLGDAILNCTIAQLLYQKYVRLNEGDLSRLRANLVKQSSLADVAERIDLSRYLRLGEGEMKSGGFRRPSILADTMEAIFGAVLVDGGFEAGSGVIARLFEPVLKHVDPKTLGKDSKTLLQEYLQGKRLPLPAYAVVETRGAAHNQEFEVECSIPKLEVNVRGSGRSRRAAEQTAAKLALDQAQAAMAAARRAKKKATVTVETDPEAGAAASHDALAADPAAAPTPTPVAAPTPTPTPLAAPILPTTVAKESAKASRPGREPDVERAGASASRSGESPEVAESAAAGGRGEPVGDS